jgi:Flp pilus assembly protein TadG
MKRHAQSGTRLGRFCRRAFWENTAASQIAEFAVSLPLLVVFIVGIFDFGTAFTLKQKLGTATQEAARVAANQVTNDLSTTSPLCNGPASICSLRDTVANSLQSSNVPRCGLDSANATQTGLTTWTFSAGTGCTGTLLLTINRGFTYTTNLSAPFSNLPYTIEATQITLQYPYQWQFNKAIRLLEPSANYAATSQLTSVAVMQNMN